MPDNRFYVRLKGKTAARILPVIRTAEGLAISTTIYAPLPEADALTPAEAKQVQDLLAIGTYERVFL